MGAFIACFIPAISKPEPPHAIFPQARFLARHCDGKIHALKARPALRLGEKRVDVEIAFGIVRDCCIGCARERSEEHTSELQSLMRISYAVFCLKKKTIH